MKQKQLRVFLLGCLSVLSLTCAARSQTSNWIAVGPNGGDARSLAYDPSNPQHVYLGTLTSWVYQSADGGASWKRLAKVKETDDLAVDNLLADESDSKTLIAAAWKIDSTGGGIFISHDAGQTWKSAVDMDGQSVRSLAQSPSNPKIWVAGTLKGVFRSEDGGLHWTEISPADSTEIHKVESVAIDPLDPKTIYAGTWHLPWKTTDGGDHWHNIKQGLIDDSDVFSIIIDPTRPTVIYTSACSGIYRSENAGELYRKVQGIPSTARRTRVLLQDPSNPKVVFAGTTEGLYRTTDDGSTWSRLTGPDVIINDVYVDPKNSKHVLLATDRSGVLMSSDGGSTFTSSNEGFTQRQVAAMLADAKHSGTIYAGVLNDKGYGGVFVTEDGGTSWSQRSQGLDGKDVFTLALSDDGALFVGTEHGLYRWNGTSWEQNGKIVTYAQKIVYSGKGKKKTKHTEQVEVAGAPIDGRVNWMSTSGNTWYAATSDGIFNSDNQGVSWRGPILKGENYTYVFGNGAHVTAASLRHLMVSEDSGTNWKDMALPEHLGSIEAITVTPAGSLWLGGREGVFYSNTSGQNWQHLESLPLRNINALSYNHELNRVVITSSSATMVFAVDESGKNWKWWNTGWKVNAIRSVGGRLAAASLYNGVVMQPQHEETAAASQAGKAGTK